MTRESLEYIRERLLREQNVQQMIRARAYEIYEMRGGQPGGDAQDWLQAESEVLAFLLAHESRQADEKEAGRSVGAAPASVGAPAPMKSSSRAASKATAAKQAASKKKATKSTTSNKPAESKSKPKRGRKRSNPERTRQ